MYGGTGNDKMESGGGSTSMSGGDGNDAIYGFLGVDMMTGGRGADRFLFDPFSFYTTEEEVTEGMQGDRIVDFEHGRDIIDISRNMEGGTFIGSVGFAGTDALPVEKQVRYDRTTGILQGDVDGDGLADWSLTLANKARLMASDFDFIA